MVKISRRLYKIARLIKFNNYHSHFAVEVLLLILMVITVGGNFLMDSDSSVLFAILSAKPSMNQKLFDAATSHVELASQPSGLPAARQVLAASTAAKPELPDMSGSALLKPNPAESKSLPHKDIEVYQVRSGDTVARIAAAYGVDEKTIINENHLSSAGVVKAGQTLRILPTSGIRYTVKGGESIASIAKKFSADTQDILDYNDIEIEDYVQPGDEIIIPNAVQPAPSAPKPRAPARGDDYKRVAVPADYAGSGADFIWPLPNAGRISQKFSNRHKGIDIPCNNCQVVAAADGIVEIAGWQSNGYGNTILLNHGDGWQTRYGHAWSLLVSAGDRVQKGQAIMISGSTGRSTGPHLHFEIHHSGSYLNPLSLVQP